MNRGRCYHILFAVALLTLTALSTWWTVFISRAIELERDSELARLANAARTAALQAGCADVAPTLGRDPGTSSVEWVQTSICDRGEFSAAAYPLYPEISARPLPEALESVRWHTHRRRVMIIGEGSLLFLLLGVCTVMLYRLVRQERGNVDKMESFISAVTHEMKTPLAGVKSLLQTLAADKVPAADEPRLLALGLKETERLQHSIENILVAGQLRTDHYRLRLERLNLRQFIDAFLEHRRPALVDRPDAIRLSWEPEQGTFDVVVDSGALRVMLENLTDNALKYGGADPTVTLRVRREGDLALISIEDSGIGFVPGHAEALFARFHRDLEARDAVEHGTGLGLPIARALARRMGGDVIASSPGPGKGSAFTMSIPLASAEDRA